jgi:hypothetical protein
VITALSDVSGLIVEDSVPDDVLLPFTELGLTIIRA